MRGVLHAVCSRVVCGVHCCRGDRCLTDTHRRSVECVPAGMRTLGCPSSWCRLYGKKHQNSFQAFRPSHKGPPHSPFGSMTYRTTTGFLWSLRPKQQMLADGTHGARQPTRKCVRRADAMRPRAQIVLQVESCIFTALLRALLGPFGLGCHGVAALRAVLCLKGLEQLACAIDLCEVGTVVATEQEPVGHDPVRLGEGCRALGGLEVVRAVGGMTRDVARERDTRLDVVRLEVFEKLVKGRNGQIKKYGRPEQGGGLETISEDFEEGIKGDR